MQSSKSETEITNPNPDDNNSTLETLFLNLFIKACKNDTLATLGMKGA